MFDNLLKPTMDIGEAGFVVLMGIGTVFAGLICIIIICKIVGLFFKNKDAEPAKAVAAAPVAAVAEPIANRQELIAAISAVAAEELGTDVSAIRITSFKKL